MSFDVMIDNVAGVYVCVRGSEEVLLLQHG